MIKNVQSIEKSVDLRDCVCLCVTKYYKYLLLSRI